MKHVVVIDSDHDMRRIIADYLSQHAFRVTAVADMQSVARIVATEVIDLLVVDPGSVSGKPQEAIQDLVALSDTPLIVISGDRIDEMDKVAALERGARDYITKPFGMREFLARVRVAAREGVIVKVEPDRRAYCFNDWTLLVKQRLLCRPAAEEIKLTAAEFNLLVAFLNSPRQVLTRERLLAATRLNGVEIFDRSVDVLILRLRRKLEEQPSNPVLIRTQRRMGYVLDAEVTIVDRIRPRR